MDLGLMLTVVGTVASAVWFLSKQLHELHLQIDKIGDLLREYRISNDNELNRQKDRITALKVNTTNAFKETNARLNDIEHFLMKYKFMRRTFFDDYNGTQGDFSDDTEWTSIQ